MALFIIGGREIFERLEAIQATLQRLERKLMAGLEQFQEQYDRISAAVAGVRGDIQVLKDLLANAGDGGLTAEETASALAQVTALADSLAALDAENPAS